MKKLTQFLSLSPLVMVFILLVCDYTIKSLTYVKLSPILWISLLFYQIIIVLISFSGNYFEKKKTKKQLNNGYYEIYYKFNIKSNTWSITYVYYIGSEQIFELIVDKYEDLEISQTSIVTPIDKPVYKVVTEIDNGVQTIKFQSLL